MRRLRSCLLVLVLAGLGVVGVQAASALPFRSVEEMAAAATQTGVAGPCHDVSVFVILLEAAGRNYTLLVRESAFILYDNAPGDATDVWFGVIEPTGALRTVRHLLFGEMVRQFPTPCSAFETMRRLERRT